MSGGAYGDGGGRALSLRPYQEDCVRDIKAALARQPNVLLSMATGGGKTIVFSHLIRHYLQTYPGLRAAVLAHRRELVTQARDKLHKVWPESFGRVGVACASLGKVRARYPVVVGTVQTLARRMGELGRLDLLIIDECHKIAPFREDSPSQYQLLLAGLREKNPDMRLLGVTATPWRTREGPIYGDGADLFGGIDWHVGLDDLITDGWLVPIRAKEAARIDEELASLRKNAEGDWQEGALSQIMGKEIHVSSAAGALEKYGEGRKAAVAFAVDIGHAELLKAAFRADGRPAEVVHSKISDRLRLARLAAFEAGEIEVLINVGVLTEGWDSPRVDLILMARPTLSPGLFVQMIGRGTREHPGKENLLVLDLVGNFDRHGSPAAPHVRNAPAEPSVGMKTCPKCRELVRYGEGICPECGFEFAPPAAGGSEAREAAPVGRMYEIDLGLDAVSGKVRVGGWAMAPHRSRNGNYMAKITVETNFAARRRLCDYLDFEGRASSYGRQKALKFWRRYGAPPEPLSVDEAVGRQGELDLPGHVKVRRDGDSYWIHGWYS